MVAVITPNDYSGRKRLKKEKRGIEGERGIEEERERKKEGWG